MFLKDHVEIHVEFKSDKAWMVTYRTHTLKSELEVTLRDANDGEEGNGVDFDSVQKQLAPQCFQRRYCRSEILTTAPRHLGLW